MDKNTIDKILGITATVQEAVDYLHPDNIAGNGQLLEDLTAAVDTVHAQLRKHDIPETQNEEAFKALLHSVRTEPELTGELKAAYTSWSTALTAHLTASPVRNRTEQVFYQYIDLIRTHDLKSLTQISLESLAQIKKENPMLYYRLVIENKGWYFEKNWLDGFEGPNNSLIVNRLKVLKENADDFIWLYRQLSDERSRKTLVAIMDNWIHFRLDEIIRIEDRAFIPCFDEDILKLEEGEIYVDAGAFTGDTVAAFLDIAGDSYSHIYTYEISRETYGILCRNLRDVPRITNRQKGVSDKKGQLKMSGVKGAFHGNKLAEDGLYTVDTVAIDQDIEGPVTFLKIDVEGVDKEALWGARQKIQTYRPKIVVDCYHRLKDIVDVPRLIHEFDNTYRFYLRQPEISEVPKFATSYCIYAIPDR